MPANAVFLTVMESILEISSTLEAQHTPSDVLASVLLLARQKVPSCDAATICLFSGSKASVWRATDRRTFQLEEGRHTQHSSPLCADNDGGSKAPLIDPGDRHSGFKFQTMQVMPMSIVFPGKSATLTCFGFNASSFSQQERSIAQYIARCATGALRIRNEADKRKQRRREYDSALRSREVVGQAQGILTERYQILPAEAFSIMRRLSQTLNVKLNELARKLIDGEVATVDMLHAHAMSAPSPTPVNQPTEQIGRAGTGSYQSHAI